MTAFIGRREFITLLGGAAAAWPLAVRAQQPAAGCRRLVSWAQAGPRHPGRANGSPLLYSGCVNSAGWRAVTSRSNIAWAEGREARFSDIAREFVRLKVDVIVTYWTACASSRSSRSHRPFQSCSRVSGTQSAQGLSRPCATRRQHHRRVASDD